MIEQIARSSAEELRAGTTSDAVSGLADLHVRQARHRRHAAVGVAAAVAVALGIGWSAGSVISRDESSPPVVRPGPTTSPTPADPVCSALRLSCVGERTYRVDLERPVVWALPPNFTVGHEGRSTSALSVQVERQVGPTAGVTVLEKVRAADRKGTGPAPGVADTPRAFVEWVAARPFLEAGKVRRTTVDGHPAWQVRVSLAPDAGTGPSNCTGSPCFAVIKQGGYGPVGVWDDMVAEYTALRLPGGGTTVIWSWLFGGTVGHLGGLEEVVHGISFPSD